MNRRNVFVCLVILSVFFVCSCAHQGPMKRQEESYISISYDCKVSKSKIPASVYKVSINNKAIKISPHVICAHTGSSIQPSLLIEENKIIMVEEETGHSLILPNVCYNVRETIDISAIDPGQYDFVVRTKLYNMRVAKDNAGAADWYIKEVYRRTFVKK